MSIGRRIVELRNKASLTQKQLADKLNVTDKAVSKWESGLGDPSIQSLIDLAKTFDVSVDYLLTGEDRNKNVVISKIQKIAFDDDVQELMKFPTLMNHRDEMHKSLIDYMYDYQSVKIFKYVLHSTHFGLLFKRERYPKPSHINRYLKLCIVAKELGVLHNDVKSPFFPLYQIGVQDENQNETQQTRTLMVEKEFIDFILSNECVTDDVWNLIKGNGSDIYWATGMSYLLEKAVEMKHHRVDDLVGFVEEKNKDIESKLKGNGTHRQYFSINKGYLVGSHFDNHIYGTQCTVTRQTVLNAMLHNQYELADRLNALSGNSVSEYDIKMDKVGKDSRMSKKDKMRESVLVEGLIDIDRLIALDDFDLYEEMIQLPATKLEEAQYQYRKSTLKDFFKYANDHQLRKTIDAIRRNKLDQIEKSLVIDHQHKSENMNRKYYIKSEYQYHVKPLGKTTVLFDDIRNHKDHRFFLQAISSDPKNLDNALERLVKDRPSDHRIIKVLLDSGAKLHHRWVEDPGDEYERHHDEVDEVATQLLRNQIELLIANGGVNHD